MKYVLMKMPSHDATSVFSPKLLLCRVIAEIWGGGGGGGGEG